MFTFDNVEYMSAADIAVKLGVNYRTVSQAIKDLALVSTKNIADMRQEGYPPKAVEQIRQHIINRAIGA